MTPTDEDFRSPERISGGPYAAGEVVDGRYRLERVLGEGGMGWLWVARDQELEIDVALKLLRTDLVFEGGAERFMNEARAAAAIEHPGVVSVSNVGETPTGTPFIVMELLEGVDLGQMLAEKGRLPVPVAVALLLPAVEALAVAHDHGVVHRDLKPDNIFLVQERGRTQPKIIDFGIARDTRRLGSALTQAGVAMGSPDYMSPEQASGDRDIDGRTDIWAICTVIYEAVCGTVPFGDRPYNALLRAIIEEPVPPLSKHGLDEPELWAILERGFKKRREERWPSMRQLGKALAGLLIDLGVDEDASGASLRVSWIAPRSSMISLENISAQTFRSAPPVDPRAESVTSVAPPPAPETRSRVLPFVALACVAVGVTAGFLVLGTRPAPRPTGVASGSPRVGTTGTRLPAAAPPAPSQAPAAIVRSAAPADASVAVPPVASRAPSAPNAPATQPRVARNPSARPSASAPNQPPPAPSAAPAAPAPPPDDLGF